MLDGEDETVVSVVDRLVDNYDDTEAMRQRLQQCVTISTWPDDEMRGRLALGFKQALHLDAYVVDDTGIARL